MPTAAVSKQSAPSTYGNVGKVQTDILPTGMAPVGKVNHNGLEITEKLLWQGWEPGREYNRNIVLTNVQLKTQKIRYKVPKSRFFTTLYPKPLVLSTGTSVTLPVTFRPLEKKLYEDSIQFRTQDGDFEVPIRAILPRTVIKSPGSLDFKMCASKDFVDLTFEVSNTGDVETGVQWEVNGPFTIEPTEAHLPVRSSCKFKATFKPEVATMYEVEAVCRYGPDGNLAKITKLTGIGKYPHLLVSAPGKPASNLSKDNLEAVVQFGKLSVGSSLTKWVDLHNLSPVQAPFRVEHPTGVSRIDTVFHCPQQIGVVPAMSSVTIPLTFSPNTVDTTSIDYFNIAAVGNVSKSIVKCVGSSIGPTVELSSSSINFMQVDVGETGTRTVDVVNNSNMEAVYQFMIDCEESVFKFQYTSGVLKAKSKQTIILKFSPTHPINYYRRITCLVHNQGPLFLDLLGTCHSEMVKPSVLLKKHLDRYRVHSERGLSTYPPEQINDLLREGKLETDENGTVKLPQLARITLSLPDMDEAVEMKETDPVPTPTPPLEEYFNDGFHCDLVNTVPHVSTDIHLADFGNCQSLRIVEDKTVNITNHTKGKITVQWMGDSDHIFSVYPTVMDIPPLKSCSFRVAFKPNVPNQLYGAELECFAFYKSLRDYRLVEDVTHCPPWCLTLSCTGHTFMPNNESFLPRYDLNTPRLVFPAVNAKESTYRTVCLTNTGTTPILYDVEKDPASTFAIKPAKGLLKGAVQIFLVKCEPAEVKTYTHAMTLRLNDNEKYNRNLQLCGSAESAEVLMESEGVVYFKPTCVGTASIRTYSIKNISRIPLRFEWKMNHADSKLLKVHPDCGIIQPNESQSQTWWFSPGGEEKYVMKPSLIVWGQGYSNSSSGGRKKQFKLRAVGEGSFGEINVADKYFDFGDIVVGSSASHQVTLYNNSSCSLHYRLLLSQHVDGPYAEEVLQTDKIGLELETMTGVLPARSRKVVPITVRPLRRVTYQYSVSYQLITPEGGVSGVQDPQHLCHILVTGVFPVMAVTDARCYGSAIGISKKQLWSLFSLDNMNVCLDSDPSAEELMYNVATRHSHRRRPPVYTRAIMDFNFSAAPLDSEPCIVNLMFENNGTVPTEWWFLFPSDLQLELEYWAETGEFDEEQLHEMKVMDNKLFSIEPKRGRLAPGDTQTVTFTYRHTMAGTDRLPVLLKLSKGREILLNFIGVTVEPERRYIHFPSNKHMFTPVPVGEKNSPNQVYELYNGGAVPVHYEFDLTPLDLIRQENFDQPIFECLNPIGEILPGRSVSVEWRFSPLEAKTYMIDVPVRVHQGDTAIITFTGVGFDKRIMGETMPITDQHNLTGVPSVQSVPIPGQLVYLSRERISFGNMPLFSRARQIVYVMNTSRERPVSFEWHVTTRADSKCLSIKPVRGDLQPGEACMCRVSFLAAGVPSFYDLDLVCEVTDEFEMGEYQRKLQAWEAEKERQKNEFVITEHDLDADKRLTSNVELVQERPMSRLQSLEDPRSTPSPDAGELTRYKTLPPIKQKSCDEEKEEERRRKRKEKELWVKPLPPRPFLLHLGLTSRTHDITDFQENFPDDYRKFYIDRSLSEKLGRAVERKKEQLAAVPESIQCNQAEANIISSILSNVLRGLLDDTYFYEAVRKVSEEETPYFRQFGERPRTAPSSMKDSHCEAGSRQSSVRGSPVQEAASQRSDRSGQESRLSHQSRGETQGDTGERRTPDSIPSVGDRMSSVSLHSRQDSVAGSRGQGSAPSSANSQHRPRSDSRPASQQEQHTRQKQIIKKTSEFGNCLESLVENTLSNIMMEAFSGEFNITSRPRFIALPKRPTSTSSRHSKH